MHFTQRFGRAGPHRRAGPRRPFPSLPPAQVPDTSSGAAGQSHAEPIVSILGESCGDSGSASAKEFPLLGLNSLRNDF